MYLHNFLVMDAKIELSVVQGQVGWESGDRFHPRNVLLDPYAKFIAPRVQGQGQIVLHLSQF